MNIVTRAPESAVEPPQMVRLGAPDIPEIRQLLNEVWAISYGPTPRPNYSLEYLRWLYGGPGSEQTALIGARVDGRLVGFKALLYRSASYRGSPMRVHLSTHLAVHPGLPLHTRLTTTTLLTVPHSFQAATELCPAAPVDAVVAFYEATKSLPRSAERIVGEKGLTSVFIPFQQMVFNPLLLRSAAADANRSGETATRAERSDVDAIGTLLRRATSAEAFAIAPDRRQLEHHLFGLPGSRVYVTGNRASPSGAIAFYLLETLRNDVPAVVVVVELLVAARADELVSLLREAHAFARESGAKGVVIENASYLDAELLRSSGVMPSARQMLAAVYSTSRLDLGNSLFCDIK